MKQFFTFLAAVLLTATTQAQVGIGTTTPDASSVLDITSTTKGLLIPRMTHNCKRIRSLTYKDDLGKDEVLQIRYKGQIIEAGTMLPKTSKIDLVLGNGIRK